MGTRDLGLVAGLLLEGVQQSGRTVAELYEYERACREQLEDELGYWRELGERYLQLRELLSAPLPPLPVLLDEDGAA